MKDHKAESLAWVVLAIVMSVPAYAGVRYLAAGGWFEVGLSSIVAGVSIGLVSIVAYCVYAAHARWTGREVALG